MQMIGYGVRFSVASSLALGCGLQSPSSEQTSTVELAVTSTDGQVVTRWINHGLETVRTQGVSTPAAGRLYAMLGSAMYDAVNGIERAQQRGREHALVPPSGAPATGDAAAAAATAAHAVLVGIVPAAAATLDGTLEADPAVAGTSDAILAGRAWGESVGNQAVALRSNDNTQVAVTIPAGSGPGVFRASFDARWSIMTPFGIGDATPYLPPPPPALSGAEYAAAFNDVKVLGTQDGDAARNQISDFWNAPGGTVLETGTWIQAGLAIVEQQGTVDSLGETARLFALLGISMADAVRVSWPPKGAFFRWRPTTAIREADTDGNPATEPDPTWVSRTGSVGSTPEYTSGTSTFAGAASTVLATWYDPGLSFCFETDLASAGPRCYDTPADGAAEAGRSRIIQGVHFEFSNQAGQVGGRGVGSEVCQLLRPVPFGFEQLASWAPAPWSSAPLSLNAERHTDGSFGLNVGGSGYRFIDSAPFSGPLPEATGTLLLDVFVPNEPPDPFWLGAVQMFASCPAANLFNEYLGQVELTGKPIGAFSTLEFSVPQNVVTALGENQGCFLSVAVNANATPEPPVLDNLRFACP